MNSNDREGLRQTFDIAAERYDQARPHYESQVFDDLAVLAQLEAGSRILEVGCGTGQATLPLAERGYRIVALELGARLAEIARRTVAAYKSVEVLVGPFEEWPLPDEHFDAVVSASAFHWVDPTVRIIKATDALRPGGSLAVIETWSRPIARRASSTDCVAASSSGLRNRLPRYGRTSRMMNRSPGPISRPPGCSLTSLSGPSCPRASTRPSNITSSS